MRRGRDVLRKLTEFLQESLEEISSFLRVSPDLAHTIRAFHKEFSLEFSYEHTPEDAKKSMLGKMAYNDLAESSFAGFTAQVQCYGNIGMSAAAAVSDVGINGFLSRGGTKKANSLCNSHHKDKG